MKYLILLTLLGLVCASPVPKAQPETEIFTESYETNEECYEDEDISVKAADVTDDIRIDTYEGGDAECDDDPINEEKFLEIIIDDKEFQEENTHKEDQARVPDDEITLRKEEDPYTDEECEDEITATEDIPLGPKIDIDTSDPSDGTARGLPDDDYVDNSECYDENGDIIEPGADYTGYQDLDDNDIENVKLFDIGNSDKAYDLEDLTRYTSNDVELESRMESFEECIDEY